MAQRRCPSCRREAPAEARFCGHCGEVLEVASPDVRDVPPAGPGDEDATTVTATVDAPPGASGDPGAVRTEPGVMVVDESPAGGDAGSTRRRIAVAAIVLALLLAGAVALTRPSTDAIVVGDGLLLPSGAGPVELPTSTWTTTIDLGDVLPPLPVGETVVIAGDDDPAGAVVGVDRTSGRLLWRTALAGGAPPVALRPVEGAGDVVAVSSGRDRTLVARMRARTGGTAWTVELDGETLESTVLTDGSTLLRLAPADDRATRFALVDPEGGIRTSGEASAVAASADLVATFAEGVVTTRSAAGDVRATVEVDVVAPSAMAVVGDLVVVAEDDRVASFDATDGTARWDRRTEAPVVTLTASADGIGVVTTDEHVGLDLAGEEVWRSVGYPLPLVRGGDPVTALVAPGRETSFDLRVVDATGDERLRAGVERGAYLALGRDVAYSALGGAVVGTSLGDAPPWEVDTEGEVRWLVLDGPTMLVVSDTRGDVALSSWR